MKKNYAKEQLLKYNSSLKKQWRVINSIIERKERSALPSAMRVDSNSEILSSPHTIADQMNQFFVNSGALVIEKNPQSFTDPLSFLPHLDSLHSMHAPKTNEKEVIKIMEKLKNSAAGSDQLKPVVIKEVRKDLIKPIVHLINFSLKTGTFPERHKEAIITPVFKKGCKDVISNYRPISILNVFSKIIEKLMYQRLITYIESTQILYNRQFGFRRGCSTEMAVTEAVSIITKALNNKQSILAVNMDLSKAFDTIDHNILCKKLAKYGLTGNILNWFKSYLHNRKQSVRFNNTVSPLSKLLNLVYRKAQI